MTKAKGSKKYPLVGVRLPSDDADVLELVKAAMHDKFAPNLPEVFRRCARLILMPMYGDNKRVQGAIEKVRQAKRERGHA